MQTLSVPYVAVSPVFVVVICFLLDSLGLSALVPVVRFLQFVVVAIFSLLEDYAVPIQLFYVVIFFELHLVFVFPYLILWYLGTVVLVICLFVLTVFLVVLVCWIYK